MLTKLKQSKLKGKIKSFKRYSDVLSTAKVETVDSTGRIEQREYDIIKVDADSYTYRVMDANSDSIGYRCSPLREECGCDGRKKGYLCRHIRLTMALIQTGKL
jgi:hypothetical protein